MKSRRKKIVKIKTLKLMASPRHKYYNEINRKRPSHISRAMENQAHKLLFQSFHITYAKPGHKP